MAFWSLSPSCLFCSERSIAAAGFSAARAVAVFQWSFGGVGWWVRGVFLPLGVRDAGVASDDLVVRGVAVRGAAGGGGANEPAGRERLSLFLLFSRQRFCRGIRIVSTYLWDWDGRLCCLLLRWLLGVGYWQRLMGRLRLPWALCKVL